MRGHLKDSGSGDEEIPTLDLGLLRLGEGAGCACKADWGIVELLRLDPQLSDVDQLQLGLLDAGLLSPELDTSGVASIDFIGPVSRAADAYGEIAAAHAMSDLYAVGAKPRNGLVIAIWPRGAALEPALHDAVRSLVKTSKAAGCSIIGGHTAHADQPLLGLGIFGTRLQLPHKPSVQAGDLLYLTKPLGSGISVGAIKEGVCPIETEHRATAVMRELNVAGLDLNCNSAVKLVTDVTGYGLCGQLLRMTERCGLMAIVDSLPVIDGVFDLAEHGSGTQAAERNWGVFKDRLEYSNFARLLIMCDPQTNGPLLFVAGPESRMNVDLSKHHLIGYLDRGASGDGRKSVVAR